MDLDLTNGRHTILMEPRSVSKKGRARYSIFSRRDDGSLAIGDSIRPPAPPGRPFRSGLFMGITLIVIVLSLPKIFHISLTSLTSSLQVRGPIPRRIP